jgi:hypothetical protein
MFAFRETLKLPAMAGPLILLAVVGSPSASRRQADRAPNLQDRQPLEVLDLHRAETIHFTAPGPAAVISKVKCSPDGDIYTIYTSGAPDVVWKAPVSRISLSSKTVTEYRTPQMSRYGKLARIGFDVSADGTLYALFQGIPRSLSGNKPKPVYLIAKYNDDGTLDSIFKTGDVPGKDFQPASLTVFADGDFLISGTTVPPPPAPLGVFSAVFDRAGSFMMPVKLLNSIPRGKSAGSGAHASSPHTAAQQYSAEMYKEDTNAVSLESATLSFGSQDGNAYVLQGLSSSHIFAVAPTGYIVHQFTLGPPADGLTPLQMADAGAGFIFIYYSHISGLPRGNAHSRGMIVVLNTETGDIAAIYRVPAADTDFVVPACAASPDDFLYLGSDKQNRLQVVRYLPD